MLYCMMTSQYSTGTVIDTSDGYAFVRGRVKGEPAAAQPIPLSRDGAMRVHLSMRPARLRYEGFQGRKKKSRK